MQGLLGKVIVSVSLFQLATKPVEVFVEDCTIVLEMKEDNDVSRQDLLQRLKNKKEYFRKQIERAFFDQVGQAAGGSDGVQGSDVQGEPQQAADHEAAETEEKGAFQLPSLPGFVRNVIKFATVHVGNIHIRLEQGHNDPSRCNAVGLCVQSIRLDNTRKDWRPGTNDDPNSMTKQVCVNRAGVYIDSEAPRAKPVVIELQRRNGVKHLPTPLVSQASHTWALEPVSVNCRIGLSDWWPDKKEPVFRPKVFLRVWVTPIKVHMHSNFVKTLRLMEREYNSWKTKVDAKVERMDALNAADTMSSSEHAARVLKYRTLYSEAVVVLDDPKARSKIKRRLVASLVEAQMEVHLEDLKLIWVEELRSSNLRRPLSFSFTSIGTASVADAQVGTPMERLPSARELFSGHVDASSTGKQSPRSPFSSGKGFVRTLSIAQLHSGSNLTRDSRDSARAEENGDAGEVGVNSSAGAVDFDELNRTRLEPRFDVGLHLGGFHFDLSLSRFSDSSVTADVSSVALSVQDHSAEEVSSRTAEHHVSLDETRPGYAHCCMDPHIDVSPNASAVVVQVLEARGLPVSGSAYLKLTYQEKTQRTKTFQSSTNPTWNQVFVFDDTGVDDAVHITIHFEILFEHDVRKDTVLGSAVFKRKLRHFHFGMCMDEWIPISKDGGALRVAVDRFHADVPTVNRSANAIPEQVALWGARPTVWVELLLGTVSVRSVAHVLHEASEDALHLNSWANIQKSKQVKVDIELLRLDQGTYALLSLERVGFWNTLLGAGASQPAVQQQKQSEIAANGTPGRQLDVTAPGASANPATAVGAAARQPEPGQPAKLKCHAHFQLFLPPLQALCSRWQIVFILSQLHDMYLDLDCSAEQQGFEDENALKPDRDRGALESTDDLEREIEGASLASSPKKKNRRQVSDDAVPELTGLEEEPDLQPFTVVQSHAIPFVMSANIFVHEARVGFTWGNGSSSTILDSDNKEASSISFLVATHGVIDIDTHADVGRERELGMKVELSVGALGLLDSKAPGRAVFTRRDHRNTDFFSQAAPSLVPMVRVQIVLPYKWGYNWNISDRRAYPVPHSLRSKLECDVWINEWAIEAPAVQYTVPALLGGIMPLTKLIVLPPLPTVGLQAVSLKAHVDLRCYIGESLDALHGARVFYMSLFGEASYGIEAMSSAEKASCSLVMGFGVARLTRLDSRDVTQGLKTRMTRKRSTVTFHSRRHVRQYRRTTDLATFWKVHYRVLTDSRIQGNYSFRPGENGRGVSSLHFRFDDDLNVFLWVKDIALMFAIALNLFNDILVLDHQISEVSAFELPAALRKEDAPEHSVAHKKQGDNPQEEATIHSLTKVQSFFTRQDIIQLPLSVPFCNGLDFDIEDKHVCLSLVIGQDDSPVIRCQLLASFRWKAESIDVGLEMGASYFNLRKAGWEPVVEPWRVQGRVVFGNLDHGLGFVKFKGAGVIADEVLEIDLSEEFVQSIAHLALHGLRLLDSDVHGISTNFYPTIDEERKHHHQYELWNFTGETIFVQAAHEVEPPSLREAKDRDLRLDVETNWNLADPYLVLEHDQSVELDFWANDERKLKPVGTTFMDAFLRNNKRNLFGENWKRDESLYRVQGVRELRYIRIKFEEYDKTFASYLVRLDRVGDYALRLQNGNLLRISVGTRNGLVRKVKILSAVSVTNRTGKDVWLTRRTWDRNVIIQPLQVFRTTFCPVVMTDSDVGNNYAIETLDQPLAASHPIQEEEDVEDDLEADEEKVGGDDERDELDPGPRPLRSQAADSFGSFGSLSPGSAAALNVNISSIPATGETSVIATDDFVCAVEYEFLQLQSMAACNFLSDRSRHGHAQQEHMDQVRDDMEKKLGSRFRRGGRSSERAKAVEALRLARPTLLRATQLVLKPLFQVTNSLPVPMLVMALRQNGEKREPEYVAPGGRFVTDETQTSAVQLKIPSEDTEWTVPIPIQCIAPQGIARFLKPFDATQHGGSACLNPKLKTIVAQENGRKDHTGKAKEASRRATSAAGAAEAGSSDGNSNSRRFSRFRSHASITASGATAGVNDGDLRSDGVDSTPVNVVLQTSDFSDVQHNFRFPVARRMHNDSFRGSTHRNWLSIRIVESRESQRARLDSATGNIFTGGAVAAAAAGSAANIILRDNMPSLSLGVGNAGGQRRFSVMFMQDVQTTRVERLQSRDNGFHILWEETLNIPFDNVYQKLPGLPKHIYLQYIRVPGSALPAFTTKSAYIMAAAKINIAKLLFDHYLRGSNHAPYQRFLKVPLFALVGDERHRCVDEDVVVGWVDVDARVITQVVMEDVAEDKVKSFASRGGGTADGIEEKLLDEEPNTDMDQFEVLSEWGSDVENDSEIDFVNDEEDEGSAVDGKNTSKTTSGMLWKKVRKIRHARHAIGTSVDVLDAAALAEQAKQCEERDRIVYWDTRLLGKVEATLKDNDSWESVVRMFDRRRAPLELVCNVANASDAGFRLEVSADLWFVNESSVTAVISRESHSSVQYHVVSPKRNVLLPSGTASYQLALRRAGELVSSVSAAPFQNGAVQFKFKDNKNGRQVLNASRFALAVKKQNASKLVDSPRFVRLWHAVYLSNKTDMIVELRASGPYRALGSAFLEPDQHRVPWHFGTLKFQLRRRTLRKISGDVPIVGDAGNLGASIADIQTGVDTQLLRQTEGDAVYEATTPSSEWSGSIDLGAECFTSDDFVDMPVTLYSPDGLPVKIFRLVLTTSKACRNTKFLTFKEDDPHMYKITNDSTRTVIINQREKESGGGSDSFSSCETVLAPGEQHPFGWADPSEKDKRLQVRMILTQDDKRRISEAAVLAVGGRFASIPDELTHSYKLNKVGKLRYISHGPVGLFVSMDVDGDSRHITLGCEESTKKGEFSELFESIEKEGSKTTAASRTVANPGEEHEHVEKKSPDDALDDSVLKLFDHQFTVVVRVLEARKLGPPRGRPAGGPRVIVSCGPVSFTTLDGEMIAPEDQMNPSRRGDTNKEPANVGADSSSSLPPEPTESSPRVPLGSQQQLQEQQHEAQQQEQQEQQTQQERASEQGGGDKTLPGPLKPVRGKPIGSVSWIHVPFRFGFDLSKPKFLRLEVVMPVYDSSGSVRNDRIGSLHVPIEHEFAEDHEIGKILPDFVSLESGPGNQSAELKFEIYLVANERMAARALPRMLRFRMAGIGVSIINGAGKREDLYGRLTGLNAGIQVDDKGTFSATVRIKRLQVDNNQPLVQNRVCVVPEMEDMTFLEMYVVLDNIRAHTITVTTFQVVVQSLIAKIDEKFLDALLGVAAGAIANSDSIKMVLESAKNSVFGAFEGKRSTSYEFVEDPHTGDTSVLIESFRQKSVQTQQVHRFFALQTLKGVDLQLEADSIIQNHFNLYIHDMHIYPVKITLSFLFKFGEGDFLTQYQHSAVKPVKGVLAGIGKWSDVVIRLGDVHDTDIFDAPVRIATSLAKRYGLMLTKQFWKGVAALEILGNPQHLIERVIGATIRFGTVPIQVLRHDGIDRGSVALGEVVASLICTSLAAPLEAFARIFGSFATIFEGTRPIRYVGKPLRYITTALEATQHGAEFLDPLHTAFTPIRKPRYFNEFGLYELSPAEPVDQARKPVRMAVNVQGGARNGSTNPAGAAEAFDNGFASIDGPLPVAISEEALESPLSGNDESKEHRSLRSALHEERQDVIIEVFDRDFVGLSEEAVEHNVQSQFQINHSIHLCIMLIPVVNVAWLFIYILHCVGILQWF
ncbi:Hypothetical protein SCF082_LOCUS51559 [Durusdinium trenchii]|uniref:C2 domain-containing protein n=1 Tax=Durusdinium trenchii TaxID=1381693 RepID=A0ABP0SFM4_9DINO